MNKRILAFGIVVTAAAWSLTGYGLSTDRDNARRHAEQSGLNLARAFAQSTERMLGTIDYALQRLRDDYRASHKGFSLAAWSKQWPLQPNRVQELLITDAKGNVVQRSDPGGTQAPVKVGAETLAAYANAPRDTIHIGRAVAGQDGIGVLHISRPILDKAGALSGLVVAAIQPDNLSQFYRTVDVGRNGFISIVGSDGFTRARAPVTPAAEPVVVGKPATPLIAANAEGCGLVTSWVDSIERLVCAHSVPNMPLSVDVGVATEDIFAAYRLAQVRYVQAASGITLVFIIMGLWLIRHGHKLVGTTEALRASEQRSAQKSKVLEVTLENMSQGIVLIEPDSRITVINQRAQELLGLPESLITEDLTLEKLLQYHWDTGEFGKDGEALDPAVRHFLRGGGLANSPAMYIRKRPNGTVIEARTIMLPAGGAVRTYSDITEHYRAEEQLAAAKEAAEAGNKSKSAFLATMSHEIRTPLNGVIGTASLLLDTELTAEQRKSVETIQDCSDILLELISDVLDFSKLEAGRMDLEQAEFALLDICEAVFKVIDNRARSKNVTLVFAPRGNLPARVVSDPARVRQVLLNLIGNAVKFTENGAVILRTMLVERDGGAQRLRFEVQDTGIGISPEATQQLFTEFTQVEASITRRYGGTGLGLAICKKIVDAMDGEIGVESQEGHGSTFWFELPFVIPDVAPVPMLPQVEGELTVALIAKADAGRDAVADLMGVLGIRVLASDQTDGLGQADAAIVHIHHPLALDLVRGAIPDGAPADLSFTGYGFGSLALSSGSLRLIDGAVTPSSIVHALAGPDLAADHAQPAHMPAPPTRSSIRLAILLAEDNAVNQRIAGTMLRNMGHSVDIAGNGRDAVAKAQIRIYDVIVMDMQMPGMDGLEATRAIREQPGPSGQVPIIAMTANAFATDRNACLAAGMNDFISKPITARKLFDAIEPWASGITETREPEETEMEEMEAQPEPQLAAEPLDPSIIDPTQMGMIEDEVGTDGLHELLISFWADAAGLLSELEVALTAADHKHASVVLHTLKGSATNLGLTGCGAACDAARAVIAEGGTPDVNDLLTILFKTLQATQPRIVETARPIEAEAA